MNKRLKGYLAFAFLGGIMLTSGVVIGIPGILPQQDRTLTNTPQDRFPDIDRPRYCGTPGAGSTPYVEEFEIQRPCTQPLAITTDENGQVWFTQTNTGNLGKFDPETNEFAEFYNPLWTNAHSMMWGIYRDDNKSVWYTEDSLDTIWKYEEDTGRYLTVDYSINNSTFPHRLVALADNIVVNDYAGGRISIFSQGEEEGTLSYWNLYSPFLSGITSEVAIDSDYDIWYANWRDGGDGLLVNFDTVGYYGAFEALAEETDAETEGETDTETDAGTDGETDTETDAGTDGETDTETDAGTDGETDSVTTPDPRDYVTTIDLPDEDLAINGVAIDAFNNVWLTDTNSSDFYKYAPSSSEFTRYTTPLPRASAYGNATGVITDPISRPYFAETDYQNRIVFNEQTANRIAVFDPNDESIVEYTIPSKNSYWSDCEEGDLTCGIAQVLGFYLDRDKIWFTEWAENNIGVVDTSVDIPYTVSLEPQTLYMNANATNTVLLNIESTSVGANPQIIMSSLANLDGIDVSIPDVQILTNSTEQLDVRVVTENVSDGTYKIALGVTDDDVSLASYLTIIIGQEPPSESEDEPSDDSLQLTFDSSALESEDESSDGSLQLTFDSDAIESEEPSESGSTDSP